MSTSSFRTSDGRGGRPKLYKVDKTALRVTTSQSGNCFSNTALVRTVLTSTVDSTNSSRIVIRIPLKIQFR